MTDPNAFRGGAFETSSAREPGAGSREPGAGSLDPGGDPERPGELGGGRTHLTEDLHMRCVMPRLLLVIVLSTVVLSGCGNGAGAPEGLETALESCEQGEISIELVAEIGAEDDGGMLVSTVTSVSYLADGRIAVFDWHDGGRVRLHESDGRWAFNLGRPGDGPGELSQPAFTHLDTDGHLVVLDPDQRRLTRFSEDGGAVLETIRLATFATMTRVLPLSDGRMVVIGQRTSEESIGLPAHLLESDGSLLRSFGGDVFGGWDSGGFTRVASHSPNGRAWVAPLDEYRLELWDLDGTLLRTFDEEPEWFNSSAERRIPRSPDAPEPRSSIRGVWEDGGCLWVASNVAREDWPDRLVETDESTATAGSYTFSGHPDERFFLTRIQLLDPETGEQVAVTDAQTGFTGIRTTGPPGSPVIGFSNHLVSEEPRLRIWTLSMGEP